MWLWKGNWLVVLRHMKLQHSLQWAVFSAEAFHCGLLCWIQGDGYTQQCQLAGPKSTKIQSENHVCLWVWCICTHFNAWALQELATTLFHSADEFGSWILKKVVAHVAKMLQGCSVDHSQWIVCWTQLAPRLEVQLNTCSFNTAIQSQKLAGSWSAPHFSPPVHSDAHVQEHKHEEPKSQSDQLKTALLLRQKAVGILKASQSS